MKSENLAELRKGKRPNESPKNRDERRRAALSALRQRKQFVRRPPCAKLFWFLIRWVARPAFHGFPCSHLRGFSLEHNRCQIVFLFCALTKTLHRRTKSRDNLLRATVVRLTYD